MGQRTDVFDIGRLMLRAGEARRLELGVTVDPLEYGGQRYPVDESRVRATLDVARTSAGYALRLRFNARLHGPCVRCLEDARSSVREDAREVDQPASGEETDSPYVEDELLNLRAWARDALALSLPPQIVCRDDCRGLCPVCGQDLNAADPGHAHAQPPNPRWAALDDLRPRLG